MSDEKVESEIAGTVWMVNVKPGDAVRADTELIIIESMKMEIPVLAGEAGVVTEILVAKGDVVAEGQPLVSLRID